MIKNTLELGEQFLQGFRSKHRTRVPRLQQSLQLEWDDGGSQRPEPIELHGDDVSTEWREGVGVPPALALRLALHKQVRLSKRPQVQR